MTSDAPHVGRLCGFFYLFLEVVVSEVEDLQSSVSPGHGEPLRAAVERHGSDSGGHVVEEPNPVHLELTHSDY